MKDLQNIDWNQIMDRIKSQPDLLINVLLIVVALVVSFSSFTKHTVAKKFSKTKMVELQKKLVALEKFE
ncbi:MAG: hypothetical protein KAI25_12895, partial [Hyphomicrobiaceae bacterium]|nr:hypothetical protein [Hyphomicrobiaceae bacterium]